MDELVFDSSEKPLVFQNKDKNSFSNTTKNFISTLTFDQTIGPVGSFSLKSRPLWSDIDILEFITSDASTDEKALKEFAKFFKNVIKKIQKDPNIIFSDFKAGIDERFIFDSSQFTREQFTEKISSFLTSSDIGKLSVLDDFEFEEEMRQFTTLRWTEDEILKGSKKHKGKIFKLWKSLGQDTLVKIDIFGLYPGRFIEVSNFIVLGRFVLICGSFPLAERKGRVSQFFKIKDLRENVNNEIIKFTKTGKFLKVLKRMFIIARLDDDEVFGSKILEFLNSFDGILGSAVSDIGDLITLITNAGKTKLNRKKLINLKDSLFDQIDILKDKIANTPLKKSDSDKVNKFIDFLILERKDIYAEDVIEILKQIKKILNPVVQKSSRKFLLDLLTGS